MFCFSSEVLGGKLLRNKDLWPFQNCDLEAVTLALIEERGAGGYRAPLG
jgi:hypothetical protein